MMDNNQLQETLPHTEIQLLQSSFVKQEYRLLIAKPKNYAEPLSIYSVLALFDHFN